MDMTGLYSFREIIESFEHRNVQVYLCEVNENIRKKLDKLNIKSVLGNNGTFETLAELARYLHNSKK